MYADISLSLTANRSSRSTRPARMSYTALRIAQSGNSLMVIIVISTTDSIRNPHATEQHDQHQTNFVALALAVRCDRALKGVYASFHLGLLCRRQRTT